MPELTPRLLERSLPRQATGLKIVSAGLDVEALLVLEVPIEGTGTKHILKS